MTAYRVLHAEDSPDDAELVRAALRRSDATFEIDVVETEADFVARLDAGTPDLILCDYQMPRFTAERALAIRNEHGLDTPFIVVSHHIGESAAVVAMQNGASDYLPKGDLRRLPKAVGAALERAQAHRERERALQALRESESMKRAILDSLGSCIAVLDGEGRIVAVNRGWTDLYEGHGPAREGADYLAWLRGLAERGDPFAPAALETLRAVAARERSFGSVEHQQAARGTPHWYVMRVGPFEGIARGVVVSHTEVSDRMMARFALEAANKRLEALSKRVIAVQEEERRAISVGLHEDIGQSLSALKIGLHRLTQEKGEAAQKLLAECLATADATLDRLRLMALELRPPQLDQLGLEDALGWLAARQREATGVVIECRCSISPERRPSAALESACYRIAQEALNNAARHARAKSIRVGVDSDGRLLKLTISDDGVGFDPDSGPSSSAGGTGLISMEERARLAGGRLKVRSVAGGGTTLSAIFPLHAELEGEEGADLAQPWA